ncbi:hypothetical protein BDU57DRAFT_519900 [Ampelomyces quisqualis]|uniref:Uncharacterized protein n=1 Tax=Ampelomyces quisqualis TaxID=50730 RepID=A0A6A5QH94_AMPQU|nr:hypothetical protein BDU57DRAFT_519900 [Ampelomyces quisqualis]
MRHRWRGNFSIVYRIVAVVTRYVCINLAVTFGFSIVWLSGVDVAADTAYSGHLCSSVICCRVANVY